MKIARIVAYRVELPLHEITYKWSGGKSVTVFDSTIVRVETDSGLAGHGEVCPLGPFYLPAYADGVRAGLRELGPHLLGEDIHLYRAISQETPEIMASRVADYRAEGYHRFQLKVGGDPDVDIERIRAVAAELKPGDRLVADANTGWRMHEAVRVA